ncbi:unnamed protein product [Candida parapsilosis]
MMDTETGGQDSAITSNNEESNTAKDVSMVDVSKANGEGFAPTNNEAGEEAQVQAQAQAQAQAQPPHNNNLNNNNNNNSKNPHNQ